MATNQEIRDTLDRFDRWLREHRPEFHASLRPGATDAELDGVERTIGRQLPEDVRSFYRWRSGATGDRFVDGEYIAGPRSPFWNGIRPMMLSEICSNYRACCEFAETDWKDPKQPGWWHIAWVPILSNDNGDYLCVDTAGVWTGVKGQIVRFWHDWESRTVEAGSLHSWLVVFVDDLEQGLTDTDRCPSGYPQSHYATEQVVIPDLRAE